MVYRIYVEKRPEYAVEARGILSEIRHLLRIKSVTGLRLLNRYDVEGISEELFSQCCGTVFSEPAPPSASSSSARASGPTCSPPACSCCTARPARRSWLKLKNTSSTP